MRTSLATRILEWGKAQGVAQDFPDDVRFVAHEAFHAIDLSIGPPWGSDDVHDGIMEHAYDNERLAAY